MSRTKHSLGRPRSPFFSVWAATLVCVGLILTPIDWANAQDPPSPDDPTTGGQQIEQINGPQNGQDNSDVGSSEISTRALKSEIDTLKTRLNDLELRLGAIDVTTRSTAEILSSISENMRKLEHSVQLQLDAMNNAFSQIAETDGTSAVPTILGNMQKSANFRHQMSRVVQGRVIVNNQTGAEQQIRINGVLWRAPLGRSSTFVPFGGLTTELVNWEAPRQWAVDDWQFVENEHQLTIGIEF